MLISEAWFRYVVATSLTCETKRGIHQQRYTSFAALDITDSFISIHGVADLFLMGGDCCINSKAFFNQAVVQQCNIKPLSEAGGLFFRRFAAQGGGTYPSPVYIPNAEHLPASA